MKKHFLVIFTAILSACSYADNLSQRIKSDFSLNTTAIDMLDYKYVFKSEQDRREKLLQDLIHQNPNKTKEQLEKEYIIRKIDENKSWDFLVSNDGAKPVLHGKSCYNMNDFHFVGKTGVVFNEYSDYAAENANAYFGTTEIDNGGFNLNLRYTKLIKLCELCENQYPEIANPWKQYLIKKLQKSVRGWNKKQLVNWYGEDITQEIMSYAGSQIQKNEQADEQKRKRKEDISKKYGYQWCSDTLKDNCIVDDLSLKVIQQTSGGILVETISGKDFVNLFLEAPLLSEDRYFLVANPKDSNKADGSVLDDGIFAFIGTQQYDSLSGTRTVKKIKRLQ